MSEKTVCVGFVGAGSICKQRHLPGLQAIEGVELIAVANRTQASARAIADEFGIASVESDWRTLIRRDDVDAVFIGTWPATHAQMSVAALEAGKHVFCQARMAPNLDDAHSMLAAAEARPDLVNMICPPPHRMSWEPYIRRVIDGGELGQVRHVRLVSINPSNADPRTITWREQVEHSGQQMLQVGIWAETLIAWLGEYESLSAVTATPTPTKTDHTGTVHEIGIPQVALIQGRLVNGATIGEHHSGVSLHESMNFVTIYGSEATLRVDAMQEIRFARAGEELRPAEVPDELMRDWRVEADFIGAVRLAMDGAPPEQRPVDPDFAIGMKYMRKVAAVHASAASGCCVDPRAM